MKNLFTLVCCLLLLCSHQAFAQEVEFHIPDQINIVQGQLSVTFKDHVSLEDAKSLIQNFGYPITKESFPRLHVSATSQRLLGEDELRTLKQEHGVDDLIHRPAPDNIRTINGEPTDQAPKYILTLSFPGTTSKEQVQQLLKDLLIKITKMDKLPSEMVIDVGDQDAEAMSRLSGHAYIKWVTYMGVAG